MSEFKSSAEPAIPFISVLALDMSTENEEVDRSRVHVVWSLSKDFGSSGIRMVSGLCSDSSASRPTEVVFDIGMCCLAGKSATPYWRGARIQHADIIAELRICHSSPDIAGAPGPGGTQYQAFSRVIPDCSRGTATVACRVHSCPRGAVRVREAGQGN